MSQFRGRATFRAFVARLLLSAHTMHTIPFGLKRTFHGFLRIMRPWFRRFSLTPARFDLLYAIQHRGRDCMLQSEIRSLLGVHPSTVSRMIDSLVDLGFIIRQRDRLDGRERVVVLTGKGALLLRRAIRETIPRISQLVVDSAFVLAWNPRRNLVAANLAHLDRVLARGREQLLDGARLVFR
jgi:DNA-binding MarR family transcriptional regulator